MVNPLLLIIIVAIQMENQREFGVIQRIRTNDGSTAHRFQVIRFEFRTFLKVCLDCDEATTTESTTKTTTPTTSVVTSQTTTTKATSTTTKPTTTTKMTTTTSKTTTPTTTTTSTQETTTTTKATTKATSKSTTKPTTQATTTKASSKPGELRSRNSLSLIFMCPQKKILEPVFGSTRTLLSSLSSFVQVFKTINKFEVYS